MTTKGPLLEVEDLVVHFALPRRSLFGPASKVHAVNGLSFSIDRGATLGLVGESGSGKTTTAQAVSRLVPATSGAVKFGGEDILKMSASGLRKARRRMQMIFQDPYSSLNPRRRAGDIVLEALNMLNVGIAQNRAARLPELFRRVGLRPEHQALFPHQFSGGQRQRIGIARALASEPELLICDEPVSALDVAIQAQILNLLRRLQQQYGIALLFISHDLGVVQHLCDEVAVMYLGRIVEKADRRSLFRRPMHPYSHTLISAVPSVATVGTARVAPSLLVEGDPPSPIELPEGCGFAGRCPFSTDRCRRDLPPLRHLADGRMVACHYADLSDGAPHERALQGSAVVPGGI